MNSMLRSSRYANYHHVSSHFDSSLHARPTTRHTEIVALRTIHLHSKGFEPLHHYHYQGWPSAFFCVLHFLFLPSPWFSLGPHVSVVVQICFAKFDAGHQEFAYATLHAQFAPYASRTQSFHLAIDERDIQVSAPYPNLRLVLLFTLLGTHRRFGFSCATAKQRSSR
jgi:hypothetical protein